jgi:hypothetical protein
MQAEPSRPLPLMEQGREGGIQTAVRERTR